MWAHDLVVMELVVGDQLPAAIIGASAAFSGGDLAEELLGACGQPDGTGEIQTHSDSVKDVATISFQSPYRRLCLESAITFRWIGGEGGSKWDCWGFWRRGLAACKDCRCCERDVQNINCEVRGGEDTMRSSAASCIEDANVEDFENSNFFATFH